LDIHSSPRPTYTASPEATRSIKSEKKIPRLAWLQTS
jgi:hypothetical protein